MKLVNVRKVYHNKNNQVEALKGITLDLEEKGITVILGPSGCGKSTLLNIMSGNDRQFEGEITHLDHVEYITQEFRFFEEMSVLENCLVACDDKDTVMNYLKMFSLSSQKNKKIKKCSNGQRKRVQFIRALLYKPSVLLCDEPTAALDFKNAVALMDCLKELSKEIQVILVTHDIALAEKYADRILTMGLGYIEKDEWITHQDVMIVNDSHPKKNGKQMLCLALYEIKGRLIENSMIIFLSFFFVLALLASIQLYTNVDQQIQADKIWKNGMNLVNAKTSDDSYDLYYESDIENLIQEFPEIIAVNAGYSSNSWKSWKKGVQTWQKGVYQIEHYSPYYYPEFDFPSEPGSQQFLISRDMVEEQAAEIKNQIEDGERQPCQYKEEMGEEQCLMYFAEGTILANLTYKRKLSTYEIIKSDYFPIQSGRLPEKANEVIVSADTAKVIAATYGFKDAEDCIGKEIEISMEKAGGVFRAPYLMFDYAKVVICGITSYSNPSQSQMFFMKGGKREVLLEKNLVNTEADIYFTALDLLLDPLCDFTEVVSEINKNTEYEETTFVLWNEDHLVNVDYSYRNPQMFRLFSMVVVGVLMLLFGSYYVLTRNRRIKEEALIKNYQYHSVMVTLIQNGLLQLITFMLFAVFGKRLFEEINRYAKMLKYDHFINWDLLFVAVLVFGVFMVNCVFDQLMRRKRR